MKRIEYRVRPVTRYIVTRFEDAEESGTRGVRTLGEYENGGVAYEVGYALCKAEHEKLGWPPDDTRIMYPDIPHGVSVPPAGEFRQAVLA